MASALASAHGEIYSITIELTVRAAAELSAYGTLVAKSQSRIRLSAYGALLAKSQSRIRLTVNSGPRNYSRLAITSRSTDC